MITLTAMEMIAVDQNVMTETDRFSAFMGRDAAFDGAPRALPRPGEGVFVQTILNI